MRAPSVSALPFIIASTERIVSEKDGHKLIVVDNPRVPGKKQFVLVHKDGLRTSYGGFNERSGFINQDNPFMFPKGALVKFTKVARKQYAQNPRLFIYGEPAKPEEKFWRMPEEEFKSWR